MRGVALVALAPGGVISEGTRTLRAWLPIAACAGIGLNSVRLRARVRALAVIPPAGQAVHPSHRFLVADGVRLDEAQRRAASAYALREGLSVLDLVPAEMAAHEVLDLARMVDPGAGRPGLLTSGRGAFQALLVEQDVWERAGLDLPTPTRVDLVAATATLRLHASTATGLALLPGLSAGAGSATQRLEIEFAAYPWAPGMPFMPLARDLAVVAGMAAAPAWALGAALLGWVQPLVVSAGRIRLTAGELARSPLTRRLPMLRFLASPVVARRTAPATTAGTAVTATATTATTATATTATIPTPTTAAATATARTPRPGPPVPEPAVLAAKRRQYAADLAAGVDRFLEPPFTACPWCGGAELALELLGVDCFQAKPGVFRYDRCRDCGHVFQNPRLTLDGLEFYYRDFYSGLGARLVEELFSRNSATYLDRARIDIPAPRRWLDVGGGFGHFCATAREVWPTTSFDGLDIGESIGQAERRGWIEHAYRGRLPDLAGTLRDRYDVVSMFHYLEHTRDPREELRAAAQVLAPGGHLIVELPNPHCPAGRWFGTYWPGWLVPQHQHLLPADNLTAALDDLGLKVLDVRFGPAHQGGDAPIALWGAWQRAAPPPSSPWLDVASPAAARVRRVLLGAVTAAAMPAAIAWDVASRRYLTAGRRSNAYRVLAARR
ncbi:2-polyprenyl-3-methyl-5-hydroxy-6-metoxy-1,4-benzoquinol methylase [Parafrankia irregularis]|uniref:2-polyprenyl-3-methyl-5-hydroxy-6-metoxy-1,4-benzoquinol methylase n=1 Tax=Parafrankia irregularis TaxID=795642 RepID=A0A0S4QEH3_9ACTN|nr:MULTISPECIES: class I SAM-dependent methyltransferase [Parafrankia]CUU53925.1 2-polyprenyl-3-methyl-5-hydroxy-6-metoxy-1,4-benzoquinol methylase [Parafrankia irregularis]